MSSENMFVSICSSLVIGRKYRTLRENLES
jgi:hypothetical protein